MKKVLLAVLCFSPLAAFGQADLRFTQGSMTSTTTTEQTITETISIERYGGAITSTTGTNVTPSSTIHATGNTWSLTTDGQEFQLEELTRAAGVIETEDIERTIETTSTTTSTSVFSQ